MKNKTAQILTAALLCSGVAWANLNPSEFVNPPDDSRPMTWMHMMDGNASKEGMTKDLEAMADAGVGGALIFSITRGIPQGTTKFNSQKFRDVLTHGIREADRLGLKLGLHNCDGWSSSGGPWVSVEDSMKQLLWNEIVVEGGAVQAKLPTPELRHNFWRDIAVVAFPAPEEELAAFSNKPKLTCSEGDQALSKLNDGDLLNIMELKYQGKNKSKMAWVLFEYEKPFPARSLKIECNGDAQLTLLASNDGQTFEKVGEWKTEFRPGKRTKAYEGSFPEVKARYFKFEFRATRGRAMGIHEMDLASFTRLPGWLPEACQSKHVDASRKAIAEAKYTAKDFVPVDQVIVLKAGALQGDQLTAQLPQGTWRIMRFGYTSTGAYNHPATTAGRGLECDKLDAGALGRHFEQYLGKVIAESDGLAGKSLAFSEIDSYEMGWQNWTGGFEKTFEQEKGYDIRPFLPLMAGRFIGDLDTADAVLGDFRAVVANLMLKNYFQRFTDLCHEHGMRSYIEPYGNGPLSELAIGGACDIPMGEFWMSKTTIVRSSAQSAHIYGKPVVSAESFTSWADLNWKGHPYLMKEYGDNSWAEGVNEFMFHRFTHQANPHVVPGMTMGNIGSHIDRTQTWWLNAGKAWMKYNQRGSFLLRQGIPVSDVLVYLGDNEPSGSAAKWSIKLPVSLNLDGCNGDVLMNRISVKDGKLVLPEGTTYSVLMLQNSKKLHLKTLKRLQALAEAGVTIIGEVPEEPISYIERKDKRAEFSALATQLWGDGQEANKIGKGQFITSAYFPEDLKSVNLEPDLIVKENSKAEFMHRKIGSDDLYFIYHRAKEPTSYHYSFRVGDRIPELWYADTGKMEKQAQFVQKDGRTDLVIDLDPSGSAFVVFREPSKGIDSVVKVMPETARVVLDENNQLQLLATAKGDYSIELASGKKRTAKVSDLQQPISLNRDWRVEFDGLGLNGEKVVDFKTLTDWKDHARDDIKYFSGTAAYRTLLNIPANWLAGDKRVCLDLGQVEIAAEVIINGKNAGILWKPPFVIDVTDQVVEGENKVEIRVTNLWSNRLIGDEYLEDTSGYTVNGKRVRTMPKWFTDNKPMPEGPRSTFTTHNFYDKDRELLSSGLFGPVVLKQETISELGK